MKTRSEYHRSIEDQLKEWEERITILRVETDRNQAKSRTRYREQIEELNQKKTEIREGLDKLARAHGKDWVNGRREIDRALGELKSSFQSAAWQII